MASVHQPPTMAGTILATLLGSSRWARGFLPAPWVARGTIHIKRPFFSGNNFHFFWFFSVTLSLRKLLMAFSSERGLQGCRVRLWTGRDGEPEGAQQRSGVLAAAY